MFWTEKSPEFGRERIVWWFLHERLNFGNPHRSGWDVSLNGKRIS